VGGRSEHPGPREAGQAGALAALAGQACPSLADALVAVAAGFRPVDARRVDEQLDDLARGLFAVAPSGPARVQRLAGALARFAAVDEPVAGLWLDVALERRRAHPLVLAALGAELGARAGWDAAILSTPHGWYAGLLDGERAWLVDVAGAPVAPRPGGLRRHCGHELAFAALCGLVERYAAAGDALRAVQACSLRARLGLRPPREPVGPDLLGAVWPAGR
jgi:hypothetical protein